MRNNKTARIGGVLAAAGLLLAQLSSFPVQAASQTTKSIDICDYVTKFDPPKEIKRNVAVEFSASALGLPADQTVKEVWIDVSMDADSGLVAMPAVGYNAPGYVDAEGNLTNWYGDGVWMPKAVAHMVVTVPIPEDYPMPDKFTVHLWGDAEDSVSLKTMELNAIGFVTGDGGTIGMMTRKGDVTADKTVNTDDVNALQEYLVYGSSNNLLKPENGDLDRSNRLNAKDLTLLKRGILDGTLTNTEITDETSMEFVSHIKLGWNLGNSLDAQSVGYVPEGEITNYETCWNNPATTKELIDAVKAAGFNTVRVPVSWGAKMDNNTYKINEQWMNRVQQVVDYVIDDGMYCILNIHHDNHEASYPYFYPSSSKYQQSEKFVTAVWEQVSERFEAYDSHLIFETLNEPRLTNHPDEWWIDPTNISNDVKDAMNNINKLNAAALNTIRKSGGNNAKRFVMMPTYGASADGPNLSGCQMPNDSHIIAEIHAYRPYYFALAEDDDPNMTTQFDPYGNGTDIVSFLNDVKSKFIDNGIPVIIDEFGATNRNNMSERVEWAKYYVEKASSYGIPCVWWDNNQFGVGNENLGLINRSNNQVQFPELMAALLEGCKSRG